jgi:hypothetical protein
MLHILMDHNETSPCTALDRLWGFQQFEAPRFQDIRHMKVVRSALRTGRLYSPGNIPDTHLCWGPGVAYWVRHCATSRTVPGLIPGGVTGYFSDISPSDRTMALESTQPLVKMSTTNIPGDKPGRCVRLTTSPHSRAECHEIWKPKPPGTLWTTPGLLRDSFTLVVPLLLSDQNLARIPLLFYTC